MFVQMRICERVAGPRIGSVSSTSLLGYFAADLEARNRARKMRVKPERTRIMGFVQLGVLERVSNPPHRKYVPSV